VLGLSHSRFRFRQPRTALLVLKFEGGKQLARLVAMLEFDMLAEAAFRAVGPPTHRTYMEPVNLVGGSAVAFPTTDQIDRVRYIK
jgi:hypothetical protein